jgi:hypothetical protein
MKKNTKAENAINRRESIALLATGLFSLHDLNNFNYNAVSTTEKSLAKMNSAIKNNGVAMKNYRCNRRHGTASDPRSGNANSQSCATSVTTDPK